MKDIADKLRALHKLAHEGGSMNPSRDRDDLMAQARNACDVLARIRTALAEFPDPDAVGRVMKRPEHEPNCAAGYGRPPCDCGLDAALAKLEEKPDA